MDIILPQHDLCDLRPGLYPVLDSWRDLEAASDPQQRCPENIHWDWRPRGRTGPQHPWICGSRRRWFPNGLHYKIWMD